MRDLLPKMHKCLIFDEKAEPTQDDDKIVEKHPNPFSDHPKWSIGHKAIKGILILDNMFKGFSITSFIDTKLGTFTGPKHKYLSKFFQWKFTRTQSTRFLSCGLSLLPNNLDIYSF